MTGNRIKDSLVAEFRRGFVLIESLGDDVYTKRHGEAGSVGEHFRHNLEFGTNLVAGIETGRIDYANRERDPRVENERGFAVERFGELIAAVEMLSDAAPDSAILVRSEVDEELWLASSVARELEFLHSHTVHHYALIAAKLKALDIELDEDFGVAPSTLKYWHSKKNRSFAA